MCGSGRKVLSAGLTRAIEVRPLLVTCEKGRECEALGFPGQEFTSVYSRWQCEQTTGRSWKLNLCQGDVWLENSSTQSFLHPPNRKGEGCCLPGSRPLPMHRALLQPGPSATLQSLVSPNLSFLLRTIHDVYLAPFPHTVV